jgi:hypothetical protein
MAKNRRRTRGARAWHDAAVTMLLVRCPAPKQFDRSVEWCTGSSSCRAYPSNVQTECGRTVAELLKRDKQLDDPTSLFHATQTCIAQRACDLRCKMENCDWMKALLPEFVGPYLRKEGQWPAIERQCSESSGWIAARICSNAMAAYHIKVDLASALAAHGCGSENDWTSAFEVINNCAAGTLDSSVQGLVASAVIRVQRERTRTACIRRRSESSMDPHINEALKGPTCTP